MVVVVVVVEAEEVAVACKPSPIDSRLGPLISGVPSFGTLRGDADATRTETLGPLTLASEELTMPVGCLCPTGISLPNDLRPLLRAASRVRFAEHVSL
jgi:hypothetical protein